MFLEIIPKEKLYGLPKRDFIQARCVSCLPPTTSQHWIGSSKWEVICAAQLWCRVLKVLAWNFARVLTVDTEKQNKKKRKENKRNSEKMCLQPFCALTPLVWWQKGRLYYYYYYWTSIIKVSLSRKTSRTLYFSQRYKKTGAAQIRYGWVR